MRELSRKIGLGEELTKYYIRKLSKEKIIKRYTTVVTKSPLKKHIVYFVNYRVKEGIEERIGFERKSMYWKKLQEPPIISEFQLMWSTTGSEVSFTWGSYQDYKEGIKNSVNAHKQVYKMDSLVVKSAVVDQVIKGLMPLRNVDTKETYDTNLGSLME
jgi:DNA-binding Lrp family transcriptional regulator